MSKAFETWLATTFGAEADDVEDESALLLALMSAARRIDSDLDDPMTWEYLADSFVHVPEDMSEEIPEEARIVMLSALSDYCHYQYSLAEGSFGASSDEATGWRLAADTMRAAFDARNPVRAALYSVVEQSDGADESGRRAALMGVTVVAGVSKLLEWIGKGRAVTSSGALRRADIAEVAAMIGVSAHAEGGEDKDRDDAHDALP